MTLHYHGTPITPLRALHTLAGRHFCVSFARPEQIKYAHQIGQSVMIDNGAFSVWRRGARSNWPAYYQFTERWLSYPTTWAVIPDQIDAGSETQDALLRQWPHSDRGSPVWHMDEPIDRMLQLLDKFSKVCIGSTSEYKTVLSPSWQRQMDRTWDAIVLRHRYVPWVHMLRGLQCVGHRWPFASVDSTDIARNHYRKHNDPRRMLDRWDVVQCPASWDYSCEENWT